MTTAISKSWSTSLRHSGNTRTPAGEGAWDTFAVLMTLRMQRNVSLRLEAAEHQALLLCPFRLADLLLLRQSWQNLLTHWLWIIKRWGKERCKIPCKLCRHERHRRDWLGSGQRLLMVQLREYVGVRFLELNTGKEANLKANYFKMSFGHTVIGLSAWKRLILCRV